MNDLNAWLKERRRIHDAATEGPWEWEPEIITQAKFRPAKVSSVGWAGYPVNDAVERPVPGTTADAIAVVDAHTTLPALLTAVEKVLELADELDGSADAFGPVESARRQSASMIRRAIEGAINE